MTATRQEPDGVFEFTDTCDRRYRWRGELKAEYAQRIAQALATELSRVAVDESEWLRRMAGKGHCVCEGGFLRMTRMTGSAGRSSQNCERLVTQFRHPPLPILRCPLNLFLCDETLSGGFDSGGPWPCRPTAPVTFRAAPVRVGPARLTCTRVESEFWYRSRGRVVVCCLPYIPFVRPNDRVRRTDPATGHDTQHTDPFAGAA